MDPQIFHTVNTFGELISTFLSIIFFVLTLFVLVYYIRRRYKPFKEINRIPQELLIKESYRNYLKNLKLKCIINNFIIVILVMECIENLGQILTYFPSVILYFVKEPELNLLSLLKFQNYSSLFTIPCLVHFFLYYLC